MLQMVCLYSESLRVCAVIPFGGLTEILLGVFLYQSYLYCQGFAGYYGPRCAYTTA